MIILHNVNDDDKNGDCTINSTDNLNRCVDKNNNDSDDNENENDHAFMIIIILNYYYY